MIPFLTILNTIAILYLLHIRIRSKFSYFVQTTIFAGTKLGIQFYWDGKGFLYIPFRNKKKTELNEEIHRLIASSQQNKVQVLTAKFSWLKTLAEVHQFEKDYSVVNRKIVERLVSEFYSKCHNQ